MNYSENYLGPSNDTNSVYLSKAESRMKQNVNSPVNCYPVGYSKHDLPHQSLDGQFGFAMGENEDSFVKDSIDLGEERLINIRTGSFFSRIYERHKGKSPDSMHRTSSPNQCSRSSSACQTEILPGSTLEDYMLKTSVASLSPKPKAMRQSPKHRENHRKTVNLALPSMELDPVLAILESDVDQLDRFRDQFRKTGVRSREKPLASIKGFSNLRERRNLHTGAEDKECPTSQLDKSDFDNTAPAPLTVNEKFLNETSEGLSSQINELIELEFQPRSARTTGNQKSATMQLPTHAKAPQARSELHLAEMVDSENQQQAKQRLRGHPFRWSTMEKRVRSSAFHTIQRSDYVSQLTSRISNSPADVSTDTGAHHDPMQASSDLTHQLDKETEQGLDVVDRFLFQKMNDMRIKMFIRQNIGCAPLWVFSAKQLTILRKIAMMQLISTQERLAGSTRRLKWPLSKSHVLLSAVGTETHHANSGSNENDTTVPGDVETSKTNEIQHSTPISIDNTHVHPDAMSAPLSADPAASFPSPPELIGDSSQENTFTMSTAIPTRQFLNNRSFGGSIFGQSLSAWTRRVGYPFPPCISNMMEHLQQVGHMAPGIFRRAGGRLRIQALRNCLEKDINWNSFSDWQPYDVADVVKQYFRELPECLLTNKLSANLIHIYTHSTESNLSILRWAVISLPDENRIALQSLLYFLNGLANRSSVTQMGSNNLAICFTPTLFHLSKYPRRRRWVDNGNRIEPRELEEHNAAQKCLCAMITNALDLFMISEETLIKCHLDVDYTDIPVLSRILVGSDLNSWLQDEVASLIKETSETKSRSGWTSLSKETLKTYTNDSGAGEDLSSFQIAFKLPPKRQGIVGVENFLRTWRCSMVISGVGISELFDRFWNHRASWDENVLRVGVLEQLSDSVQVQRLLLDERAPQPARECRLLRGNVLVHKTGAIAIVSQSVNHGSVVPEVPPELLPSAHFFKEHALLEPLQQETSCCITMISQVDLKGFSKDWYTNHWGHFLLRRLLALRHSFTTSSANCTDLPSPAEITKR